MDDVSFSPLRDTNKAAN